MTPEEVYQRARAVIQSWAEPGQTEMVRRFVERSITYIEKCPGPDLSVLCGELESAFYQKLGTMDPVTEDYESIGYESRLPVEEFRQKLLQRIAWRRRQELIREEGHVNILNHGDENEW